MGEETLRIVEHVNNARAHLRAVYYCLKAAITESHRTGPQAETAAEILAMLEAPMLRLHWLIKDLEGK
jgi:hypothetical protein